MTIDPKRVKLIVAPAVLLGLIIFAWRGGIAFAEFRTELNANFAKLEAAIRDTRAELKSEINLKTSDRWTASQMKDWSYQLERANRSPGAPLSVPAIATVPSP